MAGDTPGNLLSSTFTDELKVGTEGQSLVFSIANHKDAAILSAGHAADAALLARRAYSPLEDIKLLFQDWIQVAECL